MTRFRQACWRIGPIDAGTGHCGWHGRKIFRLEICCSCRIFSGITGRSFFDARARRMSATWEYSMMPSPCASRVSRPSMPSCAVAGYERWPGSIKSSAFHMKPRPIYGFSGKNSGRNQCRPTWCPGPFLRTKATRQPVQFRVERDSVSGAAAIVQEPSRFARGLRRVVAGGTRFQAEADRMQIVAHYSLESFAAYRSLASGGARRALAGACYRRRPSRRLSIQFVHGLSFPEGGLRSAHHREPLARPARSSAAPMGLWERRPLAAVVKQWT